MKNTYNFGKIRRIFRGGALDGSTDFTYFVDSNGNIRKPRFEINQKVWICQSSRAMETIVERICWWNGDILYQLVHVSQAVKPSKSKVFKYDEDGNLALIFATKDDCIRQLKKVATK